MNNISKSTDNIKKMYSHLSFFDEYSGSVILFVVLIIIIMLIIAYINVMENIQPIKEDWPNQRCRVNILPFAGIINKNPSQSVTDYTGENFQYCLNNMLRNMADDAVSPIYEILNVLKTEAKNTLSVFQNIRTVIANIRNNVTSIGEQIYSRIESLVSTISLMFLKLKDTMSKIHAILVTGLYTMFGTYMSLRTLLSSITEGLILSLIVIAAVITAFWIIPFTWPVAISMTAIFVVIAAILGDIVYFMETDLNIISGNSIPATPHCFHRSTLMRLNNNKFKSIEDISVGDVLENNNNCICKLKLVNNGKMYQLDNTYVTGKHAVLYKNKWITVENHPKSKRDYIFDNDIFVYCIVTQTKEIKNDNYTFCDWDEKYKTKVSNVMTNLYKLINSNISEDKIYNYLEGGFIGTTPILLNDGNLKKIQNIDVGDILINGERVTGIVEIDGNYVNEQSIYILENDIEFIGGNNLIYIDSTTNIPYSTIGMKNKKEIVREKYLYHLLTDKKTFHIGDLGNIKVGDYIFTKEFFD